MQVGNKINTNLEVSEKQYQWIVRAIQHDHSQSIGIFNNDTIKMDFNDDYQIIIKIHEHIEKYDTN